MKSVFQTITIIFSVTLILLGVCAFTMMPISSELLMKAMAIVGFIAAVLIIIAVEWWRRDEEEYEEKLKKKDRRRRISTHFD